MEEREPLQSSIKPAREPNRGDRLLTPQETADFLRVSLSWLAKARMRGDGPPYVKIGRAVRYPAVDERTVGHFNLARRSWRIQEVYDLWT